MFKMDCLALFGRHVLNTNKLDAFTIDSLLRHVYSKILSSIKAHQHQKLPPSKQNNKESHQQILKSKDSKKCDGGVIVMKKSSAYATMDSEQS